MCFKFLLINSTNTIQDVQTGSRDLWDDSKRKFIVMDEFLDLLIDTSELGQTTIESLKIQVSKYSSANQGSNLLLQQKELYSDSFVVTAEQQIKSVVGETFGCDFSAQGLLRIITNGLFNKFVYTHLQPNDMLNVTLTINKDITSSCEFNIKSFIKMKLTDCLLKRLSKNISTVSITFDDERKDGTSSEWEITAIDFAVNHQLSLPTIENIGEYPILCKNDESFNINYSLIWDDIVEKLKLMGKSTDFEYFLAKLTVEYRLKHSNRSFKFTSTTKYTKQYLLESQTQESKKEQNIIEADELEIKLLKSDLKEPSSDYFITIPQGEITKMYFKLTRKLGQKSKLKDLVIFQYFKKATVQDFKKFKGLSISLRVHHEDQSDKNSVIINGNAGNQSYYRYNNADLTPLESEPMTRVSIPSTPGMNSSSQKQSTVSNKSSSDAITSHVSEKYWQWKKSLRLLPYQCGLLLIDDDYQISFADHEDSMVVCIRVVGIQKGYYPSLSHVKLYDLSGEQRLMDFGHRFGVLCI